ncbi:MAG: glycerol-3-phosphate dehydrogenase [Citrobacter freundii]|nr:MAG: glycerol-3-phosphate dehydrogenase [Citrobacter freundii]
MVCCRWPVVCGQMHIQSLYPSVVCGLFRGLSSFQFILQMLKRISIIGSGSWATALVKVFSDSGVAVSWLVRNSEQQSFIQTSGYNPRHLSFASLQMQKILPTADPLLAIKGADLVIFAVPSAYLEHSLQRFDKEWLESKHLAVSIKGFIPGSGCTPSQYLSRKLSREESSISVIAGPCIAEEVASEKKSFLTICGADKDWVEKISSSLKASYLRVIKNMDPIGVEYAAILKNVIGIASGIANGLQYGENFQSVLVSNALREIGDFINKILPAKRYFYDSAYAGDLLITAYSEQSRNRILGTLIGRGIQVSKALQSMAAVAEGFQASKELMPILKDIPMKMPVINCVYRILHKHANPIEEFGLLEKQLV